MSSYREPAPRVWPDHRGQAVSDAVYVVKPDPAIGEVITAWSNQTSTGFRRTPPKRIVLLVLGLALATAFPVFLLGAGTTWLLSTFDVRAPIWLPYAGWALPVLGILAYAFKVRPRCSYIGEDGVHEHVRHGFGRRDRVLRFADAASLTVAEIAKYENGVYQGTEFALKWRDPAGRVLFELSGLRYDHGMFAGAEQPDWELAEAAEARWNALRWERAEEEHAARGEVRFGAGELQLGVSDGALRIGEAVLRAEDIERVELVDGMLEVRQRGARKGVLRSEGITRIPARDVEDFATFLRALQRWAGVAVARC